MNIETYNKELKILQDDFNEKKRKLAKEFALSNNPVKEGDIIYNGINTIRVKKITVYTPFINNTPASCVFSGDNLNKNGETNKRSPTAIIYQSGIKTHVKAEGTFE